MTKLLVIDDEPEVRHSLESTLRSSEIVVLTADSGQAGIATAERERPDCIVLDLRLPDMSGLEVFDQLRAIDPRVPVIFITDFSTTEIAIEAMRRGAFEYLLKPLDVERLRSALDEALEVSRISHVPAVVDTLGLPEPAGDHIVGESQAMQQVYKLIGRVAPQDVTVLVQGESGTGKELVARAIYRESPRAGAPFIRVNCAAVPENLIESEFFGHEKGAFTGAMNKREGRFELAHGGTILLDEISEISPQVQAKLLRVLQERELERVGGSRTIKVDVRVIATTNRDLEQSVEKKEFRQDLYFRLNVVPVFVPPLRERREDVLFLAEQFMHRFARKHGVKPSGMSPACRAALEAHSWPGNVRELQNVIERAVILCADGEQLQPAHLGFGGGALAAAAAAAPAASSAANSNASNDDVVSLGDLEKNHILTTLDKCGGNRTHAARKLGISIRTLRNKLNEYGLGGKGEGEAEEAGEAAAD